MPPLLQKRPYTLSPAMASLPPVIGRIYAARGINDPQELSIELKDLLPDHLLLNTEQAAALLSDAIMQQKKLLIVGDYDADGATSTALAVSVLKAFGALHVEFLIPNRFTYGYGLTPEIVTLAATYQPDLLITVDNGIASHAGVDQALKLGMQVLITDHHLPAATLPKATVIVNPNQPTDTFPSKALAGVGVMFYVLLALRRQLRALDWFAQQQITEINLGHALDLVALGTIADVVPLDRNNRLLVQQGCRRIQAGLARPGIMVLLKIAGKSPDYLTATDLAFNVAPRLNAAGRLQDMSIGIRCLLAATEAEALPLAEQLHQLNAERKQIEQAMQKEAVSFIQRLRLPGSELAPGICLFDDKWHQGVIGIVAGRLKDRYHRPVIAFAQQDDTWVKGSGRSIEGIHLRDVLDRIATHHPDLLVKFGGHAMAAGLTILKKDLAVFSDCFAETVRDFSHADLFKPTIFTDGELSSEEICLDLAFQLKAAGPFGQQFPEPLFEGEFRLLDQQILQGKHLKCIVVREDSGERFQAIAFNIYQRGIPLDWSAWPAERIYLAYRLDINFFQGIPTLQLLIEHIELR